MCVVKCAFEMETSTLDRKWLEKDDSVQIGGMARRAAKCACGFEVASGREDDAASHDVIRDQS